MTLPTGLKAKIAKAGAAGTLSIALILLPYLEGTKNRPYLDVAGISTVCTGHTGDIENRIYSNDECRALLTRDLDSAFREIERDVKVPIAPKTSAALASFTFNVGNSAFRKSTLLRRLNAGEGATACDEMERWVYAGGRVIDGLKRRRMIETELCREGFGE